MIPSKNLSPPPQRLLEIEVQKWTEFLQHSRGRSARTVRAYTDAIDKLAQFLGGQDFRTVTVDELTTFTGIWLHKQGLVGISRRPIIAAVRGFYAWLTKQRVIAVNPALEVNYPKTGLKLPRLMALSNAERLLWAPDFHTFIGVRDAAMLALMMGCGLRVHDVVSLNTSQLLTIDYNGEQRMAVRPRSKGNRERTVPVPREAELTVRLYLEHEGLEAVDRRLENGDDVLFISVGNKNVMPHEYRGENRRLNVRSVQRMVERYGRQVGIPEEELHPHALRHLFGAELAEDDVDLLMRQSLMGHADAKTTRIYSHLAMRKHVAELDRAGPMAKMRTPAGELLARLRRTR
ncbi:tyrosine-type recombinase/integrase [Burkholderia cenocepacia]|uniref:tyrosine-type recombinase/integrase n=1 Tax=Burkholderia cenocepacia TaxID=95486 RepID=UPI001B94D8AC|nr:tyrosine-type recombinase/integrase [Burkholderia cenocepacia]MBR8137206.1 tyrosine-type recombinase/integrase [Burkholderia cenocepacia]